MTFITIDEAKEYLRVDTSDEDAVIGSLLSAAGNLCRAHFCHYRRCPHLPQPR